jgi:transcriptional regulator with XRE-family HTH domain
MNIFAERLKALRKNSKLNRKQLGEIIGVTEMAVKEIEYGNNKTTLDKTNILADYFGVSIDYLVGRTDNPEVNKLKRTD